MSDSPRMKLEPRTPTVPQPRPMTNAAGLIRRFWMDGDQPLVTEKWVRSHVPGKLRLSHSRVFWVIADVAAWLEKERAA
jgi:hypothetical protein